MTKKSGQAFLAPGVVFSAMGIAGKTTYLGLGLAFVAIGLVAIWRGNQTKPRS